MNRRPFLLVSWQDDFLRTLLDTILEQEKNGLDDALFIFPHLRPVRYLERLIREDRRVVKPCLMPSMFTSGSLFETILAEAGQIAAPTGLLDRVGLLLHCMREEQQAEETMAIPVDSAETFFPWGVRLANLFEECFLHNRPPLSFQHLEGELLPFAAAILQKLSSLYHRYCRELELRNRTTPGLTAQRAAALLETGHEPRCLFKTGRIYLAGFYSLTGTEDTLFKKLWREQKATVVIQADPALAQGKGHWSCSALAAWIKNWRADIQEAHPGLHSLRSSPHAGPQISFYHCYDEHSQLAALQSALGQEQEDTASQKESVVILPDAGLLIPVLHHIHQADVNVSMGYPLDNAPLNRFLESLLTLHENTRSGGQYWKDCVRILRQPYVKMLGIAPNPDEHKAWLGLLQQTEHALRRGTSYVDLARLLQQNLAEMESGENQEKLSTICDEFKQIFIEDWTKARPLKTFAGTIKNLCALLLKKGSDAWRQSPLDAECLYRFMQTVLPELEHSALSDEALPASTLFAVFRELVKAERVPFEAYPLTAVQIMGLLESRLLRFDTVYILDAVDDLLPGGKVHDPLLPDGLRVELGLPDADRRSLMQAYYFFRLIQGADKVHLFWQEGIAPGALQDTKKNRSRFVEELIWREEQKKEIRRVLQPERPALVPPLRGFSLPLISDGPLHQAGSRPVPLVTSPRSLNVTPPVRARIRQILAEPLSATRLNGYLRCPALFYYRELACLSPLAEVTEDDDPLAVGELLHQVLSDFYRPKIGQLLQRQDVSYDVLEKLFFAALAQNKHIQALPADVRIMLKLSGPRSLARFLRNQPETTTVLALETKLEASLITTNGLRCRLKGRIDRIDARPPQDSLLILDYKTGWINRLDTAFWLEEDLWKTLENDAADLADEAFFLRVAEAVPDVQLPFYLYLAAFGQPSAFAGQTRIGNAGWVDLRDQGQEVLLFPDDLDEETRSDIIENKIELLLEYLVRRLAGSSAFLPRPGKHCSFCEFQEICIVL